MRFNATAGGGAKRGENLMISPLEHQLPFCI